MIKIYWSIIALYLGILTSHAQTVSKFENDTAGYQARKLTIDEVNFVSAYYHQNGNNSAVTGGIGTEKLTDFANTFDIQLSQSNGKGKNNSFHFELGIDHYTSASSDKIDPHSVSSASMQDTRIYPSLNWTSTDEKTGNSFGFTGSYSHEFDYQSFGGAFNYTRISGDKNRQFDFKAQAFFDTWQIILPIELRPAGQRSDRSGIDGTAPRNSFSTSFSVSQVINQKLQALIITEPSFQKGQLATRYQRDYFTDGTEKAETLPGQRFKLPVAIRLNYFPSDRVIVRTFYRFYTDSWGIRAHTAEIEVPLKLTSFLSVSPYYRYYHQTGTGYFRSYGLHNTSDTYFTSDYDLSTLSSNFFGANARTSPPKGVLGWEHFSSLELRYGHYIRSTGLNSDIITLAFKFK